MGELVGIISGYAHVDGGRHGGGICPDAARDVEDAGEGGGDRWDVEGRVRPMDGWGRWEAVW